MKQKQNEQLGSKRGGQVPSDKATAKLLLSTLSTAEKKSIAKYLKSDSLAEQAINGLLEVHNLRSSQTSPRHLEPLPKKEISNNYIQNMFDGDPAAAAYKKNSQNPQKPSHSVFSDSKSYLRNSNEYGVRKDTYTNQMKMGGVNQDSKLAKALANVLTDNDMKVSGANNTQQKQIFKTGGVNEDSRLAKALSETLADSYSELPVANPPLDLNKLKAKNKKEVQTNYLQSMISAADMPANGLPTSTNMIEAIGLPQSSEGEPKSGTTTPVMVNQPMPLFGAGFAPPNTANIGIPMNDDNMPLSAAIMQKAKQNSQYVEQQEDSTSPNDQIKSQFWSATYLPVAIPKVQRTPAILGDPLSPLSSSSLTQGSIIMPGTIPSSMPDGQAFQRMLQADQSGSSFSTFTPFSSFDFQRSPSQFQLGMVRAKVAPKAATSKSNSTLKSSLHQSETQSKPKTSANARGLRVWSKAKSHAKASSGAASSTNSNSNSASKANQKAGSSTMTQARSKGSKGGSSDYGYGQGSGYGYGSKSWGYGGGGGWAGQPPKGGFPSLPNYGQPPKGIPGGPKYNNAAPQPAQPAAAGAPAQTAGQTSGPASSNAASAPATSNAAAQSPAAPSGQKWAKIKTNLNPKVTLDSSKIKEKYVKKKVSKISISKVETLPSTKDKKYASGKYQSKPGLVATKPQSSKKIANQQKSKVSLDVDD